MSLLIITDTRSANATYYMPMQFTLIDWLSVSIIGLDMANPNCTTYSTHATNAWALNRPSSLLRVARPGSPVDIVTITAMFNTSIVPTDTTQAFEHLYGVLFSKMSPSFLTAHSLPWRAHGDVALRWCDVTDGTVLSAADSPAKTASPSVVDAGCTELHRDGAATTVAESSVMFSSLGRTFRVSYRHHAFRGALLTFQT